MKYKEFKEQIKQKCEKEHFDDIEKLRYVYITLGQMYKFDVKYSTGSIEEKKQIYNKALDDENLDKLYKSKDITCKSLAYILSDVLNEVGIKCVPNKINQKRRMFLHYNNIVEISRQEMVLDLQSDLENIQSNSQTKSFCLDPRFYRPVFKNSSLKQIDEKIGYIAKDKPYADEYTTFLKYMLENIDNFEEKADIFFENVNPKIQEPFGYCENVWHIETMAEQIFTKDEQYRIRQLNTYYVDEEKAKEFWSGFYIRCDKKIKIYMQDKNTLQYKNMKLNEFFNLMDKGLKINEYCPIIYDYYDLYKEEQEKQEEQR